MSNHTDISGDRGRGLYLTPARRAVLAALAVLPDGRFSPTRGRTIGMLGMEINQAATDQGTQKWEMRQIRKAVLDLADAGFLVLEGDEGEPTGISLNLRFMNIMFELSQAAQYELDEMIRNAIDTRRPADPTKGELFKSLGNRPRDEEILDLVEAIQGEEDEEDATIVLFSETAPNHILKGVVRSALLDCLDARALHLLLAGAYQNAPAAEEV